MSRVMLITGSSRGIGASIARKAHTEGYEVILHGSKESQHLIDLSNELCARYITFDLSSESDIRASIQKLSRIDVLINSAGINISKPFPQLSMNDWQRIYDVNVLGLASVVRNSIEIMQNNQGLSRIVNIASVKGTYSAVGRIAYASSKSAVINMTTGLAKELAPNILVNCISPGFIKTDMTSSTWSERIKKQVDSILLGRMANPEEVADLVLFLSSEKNTYITGQNIKIDGGFGIKNE